MRAAVALPARVAAPAVGITLTLLAATATVLVTREALTGRPELFLLFVAAAAAVAVFCLPQQATFALLAVTCTLWLAPLMPISVAGIRSDEGELLAVGLLGAWLIGRATGALPRSRQPYGGAFAVFAVALIAGCWFGLEHTAPAPNVVSNAKAFSLYFLVLPLCAFFRTDADKQRLAAWVVRIATVGAIAVLAAEAMGIQLQGRPGTAIDIHDIAQTTRVRPALLPLLFLATILVVAQVSAHGASPLRILRLTLFAAVWAVSYNRSSWIALTLAMLILLAVRPGPRHPRRTLATLLAGALAIPLAGAAAVHGYFGPIAATVVERATTVFEAQTLESNSLADRTSEYTDARRALSRQPVFGVGVAGKYGARRPYYDPQLKIIRYQDRVFSHNTWLYLYLQLGVLGVLAFLLLALRVARELRGRRTAGDQQARLIATAAVCTLIGQAVEAVFNPNLLLRPSIIVVAVCATLVARPADEDARDGATSRPRVS